jgi:hypothetical protein
VRSRHSGRGRDLRVDLGQHDLRIAPHSGEFRDKTLDPADDEIVAQVQNEVVVAEEILGHEDGVRQSEWRFPPDVGGAESECGSVPDRLPDSGGGVADHDPNVGDP